MKQELILRDKKGGRANVKWEWFVEPIGAEAMKAVANLLSDRIHESLRIRIVHAENGRREAKLADVSYLDLQKLEETRIHSRGDLKFRIFNQRVGKFERGIIIEKTNLVRSPAWRRRQTSPRAKAAAKTKSRRSND